MPVTVEIRRASERFVSRGEGTHTRHSFSFGQHYDPDNVGFGPMVCHDDHRLRGGAGFAEHPHRDTEIVTWVLTGAVVHTDSTGATATVPPGTVQVQSAGSGVTHSEVAATGVGPTRFVQTWLTPDETGTEPSLATAAVELPSGVLVPVASGHRADAVVRLGTAAATFWVVRLAAGEAVTLPDEPRQHVYVARGALTRSSLAQPLEEGDAFLVTDHQPAPGQPAFTLTAGVPTELLLWTFAR